MPSVGADDCSRDAVLITSPATIPSPSSGLRAEGDDRLAGVDREAHLEIEAFVAGVHLRDCNAHAERGAHRSLGVVAVRDGCAENADHRVADELLDGAPERLDLAAQPRVVRGQDRPHILGIQVVRTRGEPDQVDKEDGDDLPLLAPHGRPELVTACVAETRIGGIRLAAVGTAFAGRLERTGQRP